MLFFWTNMLNRRPLRFGVRPRGLSLGGCLCSAPRPYHLHMSFYRCARRRSRTGACAFYVIASLPLARSVPSGLAPALSRAERFWCLSNNLKNLIVAEVSRLYLRHQVGGCARTCGVYTRVRRQGVLWLFSASHLHPDYQVGSR